MWNQLKYKKTIILNNDNNVATFNLAPSFREFEAYEARAGFTKSISPICAQEANIIKDNDNEDIVPYSKPVNPWKEGENSHSEGDSKD